MKPFLIESRDKQRHDTKTTAKNNISGKYNYIHA